MRITGVETFLRYIQKLLSGWNQVAGKRFNDEEGGK
jgi:hypothetical protein